ncbi:MAG: VWA domain-containing protein [Desulfurococcales archaeon]|nr:VWA domain-containing protein [Desulfurococcales archaeon]MCE4626432.1 VWA domain-containing protein [Desulfurococcales archaeon]
MKLLVKAPSIPSFVAEYQGELIVKLVGKLLGGSAPPEWMDPQLAASIYYAFYLPIPILESDEDPSGGGIKKIILRSVIEDAGFWRVKPQTVVDRITSLVASASLLERIIRNLPKQRGRSSAEGKAEETDLVRRAVSAALQQAESDSKIAKSIESLINSSLIGNTSELAFEDVLETILNLARKTDVSRVLEKLEGVKIPANFARKTERFTKGWIEGVELGGDLERVHPSQLSLPDEVFYLLYAESRLLLYKRVFMAHEGPLYVLLDKSGSMSGNKIDWARAVAIALFQTALREGRSFYVRFFDAMPHNLLSVIGRPRPRDIVSLLEYLGTVKAGGGTDITRALAVAASDIEANKVKKNPDVILITDGEDRLSESILNGILSRSKINLHTVMIGGDNKSLRSVSSSYMSVARLTGREVVRVVEMVEKTSRAAQPHKP